MLSVSPSSATVASPVDVFAIRGTQGSRILCLQQNSQLVAVDSLAVRLGRFGSVYEPPLSSKEGETATNYLWQYQVDGGASSNLVFVFYGGSAAQTTWEFEVTPSGCTQGSRTAFSAGRAEVVEVMGVSDEELCRHVN
jgi:hypothetical protein